MAEEPRTCGGTFSGGTRRTREQSSLVWPKQRSLLTILFLDSRSPAHGLTLIVFAIPVLALIGLYAAVPQRASEVLGSVRAWMEKSSRAITVAHCFVFGALFLIRGISGL